MIILRNKYYSNEYWEELSPQQKRERKSRATDGAIAGALTGAAVSIPVSASVRNRAVKQDIKSSLKNEAINIFNKTVGSNIDKEKGVAENVARVKNGLKRRAEDVLRNPSRYIEYARKKGQEIIKSAKGAGRASGLMAAAGLTAIGGLGGSYLGKRYYDRNNN